MSALDLTDAEIAELIGDGTCTHLPQIRMALEIQRRRDWKHAAVEMTVLEARAADAVRAARGALASGLDLAAFDYDVPEDATAVANLAGAILLAGQAVRR